MNTEQASLAAYRRSPLEQERIGNLLSLIPRAMHSALDVGARDGYISKMLATCCLTVTALDLEAPQIDDVRIQSVQGDVTSLAFDDGAFDFVLCSEVLEHLQEPELRAACHELQRVTAEYLLIGVPFKQDTRLGCTTCYSCGRTNPPWAHVGVFDAARLESLFEGMEVAATTLVGRDKHRTNALSTWLLAKAGNPYGTYVQEEPCIHCGAKLQEPPPRNFIQRVETKIATRLNDLQSTVLPPKPIWIHMLLRKVPLAHPARASEYESNDETLLLHRQAS